MTLRAEIIPNYGSLPTMKGPRKRMTLIFFIPESILMEVDWLSSLLEGK